MGRERRGVSWERERWGSGNGERERGLCEWGEKERGSEWGGRWSVKGERERVSVSGEGV